MLFPASKACGQVPAPTIALTAPSQCNSDLMWTCSAVVAVSWSIQDDGQCTGDCHHEYCLTEFPTTINGMLVNGCQWTDHEQPQSWFQLASGNGEHTVYGQYRLVINGVYYPSPITSANITLDASTPTIVLNSPGVLVDPLTSQMQLQLVNERQGQWVSYSLSTGVPGEPVDVTVHACRPLGGCTAVGAIANATPPYQWAWTDPSAAGTDTYLQLSATDAAGATGYTPASSVDTFTLFDPDTAPAAETCDPSACITLADGTTDGPGHMPGDDPSSPLDNGKTFSGYADPSMRADSLVTPSNPYGTNLWMLYSWPKYNMSQLAGQTVNSPAIEIHLAYSNTNSGANGGTSWTAWCDGCGGYTPIYPSAGFPATNPTTFSSHEVANFWSYVDQASQTETWYAVHLMYFVTPPEYNIGKSIQNSGCLVLSVTNPAQNTQDTPGQQAWPATTGPSACDDSANFPVNSVALQFQTLNDLIASSPVQATWPCTSWGEPAIMISGHGTTAYLAAECFDQWFVGQGYWMFKTDLTTNPGLQESGWELYDETFTLSPTMMTLYQQANYISEFDWATRSDGTIVALFSPSFAPDPGESGTPFNYGCAAATFTLATGLTDPFGPVVAMMNDTDDSGPSSTTELQGPNGCTFEPTSNPGVVIVRHLEDVVPPNETVQTYSLVDTGLIP
jgi:hypothetical protein